MSKSTLTDVTLLCGGHLLSTAANQLEVGAAAAEDDVTNFASPGGWQEFLGAAKSADISFGGFWEAAEVEQTLWDRLGLTAPFTFSRSLPVARGDVGFSALAIETKHQLGLVVNKAQSFSLSLKGSGPLLRVVCVDVGTFTASGNSSPGVTLPAAAAGQTLYAFLHVTAVSGAAPTADLVLQRDDDLGFPSPIAAITFDQVTAIGWQMKTLAAGVGISDTKYRVARTLGGTTPSFTYHLFVGVL